MLAVGIIAVMVAMGTFSAQKAGAQNVEGNTIGVQPASPSGGEVTYVRVNFTTTAATIESGQEISITLTGFEVPADIPTSEVSIRAGTVAGNPAVVSVSGSKITLEVGSDSAGVPMSIAEGVVSVIFTKRVGITAPIAAGPYAVTVAAGGTAGTNDDAFTISRTVAISPSSGDSDTEITVTGTSFTDGAATIYKTGSATPATVDVTFPAGSQVGTTNISSGKFTATIDVTTPLFTNGEMNYIHVRDAAGQTAAAGIAFTLTGKVEAPAEMVKGSVGLEVTLTEALASTNIESVKIGGVSVWYGNPGTTETPYAPAVTQTDVETDTDGSVTININVLGTVATGSKELALFSDADPAVKLGSTMVDITALALSLTPTTAVSGQTVDLDGCRVRRER